VTRVAAEESGSENVPANRKQSAVALRVPSIRGRQFLSSGCCRFWAAVAPIALCYKSLGDPMIPLKVVRRWTMSHKPAGMLGVWGNQGN
jgi:hypothetical protein